MSVLDKFLNVIKLNDDDEYDEEDYLDEEADEEEVAPRSRVIKRREDDLLESDYDNEDDDEEDDDPVSPALEEEKPARSRPLASFRRNSDTAKVSSIRSRRRNPDPDGMKVCVIRPHSMEDAREITDSLLANCTVVLNVEGLELELSQRIIDFTAGSCYAMDGNLQKVSTYIFVITPASVDLTGDFQEIISDAFDVPFDRR